MEHEPEIRQPDPVPADGSVEPPVAPLLSEELPSPPASPASEEGVVTVAPDAFHASVSGYLQRFEERLTDHLQSTESCSREAFNKLYEEMQGYKRNFLREAQNPLLQDLMLLYDSIDTMRRNYANASTVDVATLYSNLEALQVEAEEVLARSGVERMFATPERLDVRLQQAVKVIPTDDPEEDLVVVDHLKAGFLSGERAMRKEKVVVKKWRRPATAAEPVAEESA